MSVYDCFTFFNELELLEIRLELLDEVVDKFVISEGDHTHSGNYKGFIYPKNSHRFKKWENKIIYLPLKMDLNEIDINNSEKARSKFPHLMK